MRRAPRAMRSRLERRMEWGEMHQSELMENWTSFVEEGIFRRIGPLVSDNRE